MDEAWNSPAAERANSRKEAVSDITHRNPRVGMLEGSLLGDRKEAKRDKWIISDSDVKPDWLKRFPTLRDIGSPCGG